MSRSLVAAPAFAAGLVLMSVAPATADYFNPFFTPWRPHAYHYRHHWRPAKPRVHHRHSRHGRTRPSQREAVRKWPKVKGKVKGPYQLVVSIAKQQVTLYGQDGLIGRAGISTGRPAHPTPMGVFSVLSKARWHRSNIYSGAPMPYMQRITWSGIALHAGPRPGYPASHGCIRLPADFAIHLFHTTKVGTRVVVTRDPVAPIEISSPKLFVPKSPDEKLPAEKLSDDKAAPKAAPVTVATAGTGREAISLAARSSGAIRTAGAETADASTSSDDAAPATEPPLITGAIPLPPQAPAKTRERLSGPVSVFVSLKQKRVFVRQGFHELFDMPVTIADPDQPIGTHIYTAMGPTDDGKAMRWNVISIPSGYPRHGRHARRRHHHRVKDAAQAEPKASAQAEASTASKALDRITLPPAASEVISSLLTPGSSLIVSDNRLSDETDSSTNFIVLTR